MHLHRRVKQFCVAFVFALAIGFTILIIASASTSYAPRSPPSPAAADPGDWPEGFAIVVGINDYPGTVNHLSYCVPDARGVAALLPKLGFTPEHVVSVTDAHAKKANLTAEIAKIAPQMGPNDVFVLYYSGHGARGCHGFPYRYAPYLSRGPRLFSEFCAGLKGRFPQGGNYLARLCTHVS